MSSSELEDDLITTSATVENMEAGHLINDRNNREDAEFTLLSETAPLLGNSANEREENGAPAGLNPAIQQTYDAIQPILEKKSKKDKDKDKPTKSGQKVVADALKTDMAAERTFFKWLWTGLHVGAIGTFIFVTFDDDKSDPYRFAVVAFSWSVAFGLVLYGLFAYNRRRVALREGRLELLPRVTRDYGPCIVVLCVALVVLCGFAYALLTGAHPKESRKSTPFAGV